MTPELHKELLSLAGDTYDTVQWSQGLYLVLYNGSNVHHVVNTARANNCTCRVRTIGRDTPDVEYHLQIRSKA